MTTTPARDRRETSTQAGKAAVAAGVPRIAVSAAEAAAMLGIGRTLFVQLVEEGRAPAPKPLGRRKVWVVSEIEEWARAGFPCRKWEA